MSSSEQYPRTELLSCRRLLVGYSGRAILPPLEMTARKGEFWAVVGVNGSGKTTFLRTVLGLLPEVGGQYRWRDDTVLSYVPQRNTLDAGVPNRVRDFVAGGRDRDWSFLTWRSADEDALRRALEETRATSLSEEQFGNLSEGQKGRVRLARALISNPNVLILDEPTSAVDSVAEPAIFETLEELRTSRGVTLFVVSHRTTVFSGRATHAVFVDRGEGVAFAGKFQDVVRAPPFLSRYGSRGSRTEDDLEASRAEDG